ncbi:MAG: PDZ domain-containing protein [Planctomycetota bacterium]|nr:MAG: PDZ domain-containing protein [Planctomycetota bacterium]
MSSKLLTPSLALTAALVLGAAVPTAARAQQQHAQQPRLIRIAPRAQQPRAPQASAPFEAADWSQRLNAGDLAQRERAYDELAQLARGSEAARDWVREQAKGDGELAWTCRLLQRELDQSFGGWRVGRAPQDGSWLHGFDFRPFAQGGDPFATRTDLDDLRARMQQLFDEMQGRFGAPAQPGQPGAPRLPGVQGSSRTLQLEQGPDGCKVTVEEDVDGKLEKRTYEAQNLEELFEAHPELREKVGITIERPQRFSFGGDFGSAFPGWYQLDRGAFAPATGALRTDILGVVVVGIAAERAHELGLESGQGLLVQRTEPGTIASVLGIGAGDVLAEINGRRIHSRDDIGAALRAHKHGEEVSVTWYDASGQKRTRTWREGDGSRDDAPGAAGAGQALPLPKQDV